jgi:hypothetical protein
VIDGPPIFYLENILIWHRKQEAFAGALFAAYLEGNVTSLAVGDLNLPEDASFVPFDVS